MALCALGLAGAPSLAGAQALTDCPVGQMVTDREEKTGVIVSGESKLCQVKYPDGQVYGWIYWNLRPAAASAKSAAAAVDAKLPTAAISPSAADTPAAGGVPAPTILRAAPPAHTLVYRTDLRGQITLTAIVNGAPIRFLVDTGATLVSLTPEDARAAGIGPGELRFDHRSQTANGTARNALVTLREVRIEQLSIDNVPAWVTENSKLSLLGMSFLKRLKSFEMREGALTISW